jgi:hypothetical protein
MRFVFYCILFIFRRLKSVLFIEVIVVIVELLDFAALDAAEVFVRVKLLVNHLKFTACDIGAMVGDTLKVS